MIVSKRRKGKGRGEEEETLEGGEGEGGEEEEVGVGSAASPLAGSISSLLLPSALRRIDRDGVMLELQEEGCRLLIQPNQTGGGGGDGRGWRGGGGGGRRREGRRGEKGKEEERDHGKSSCHLRLQAPDVACEVVRRKKNTMKEGGR